MHQAPCCSTAFRVAHCSAHDRGEPSSCDMALVDGTVQSTKACCSSSLPRRPDRQPQSRAKSPCTRRDAAASRSPVEEAHTPGRHAPAADPGEAPQMRQGADLDGAARVRTHRTRAAAAGSRARDTLPAHLHMSECRAALLWAAVPILRRPPRAVSAHQLMRRRTRVHAPWRSPLAARSLATDADHGGAGQVS